MVRDSRLALRWFSFLASSYILAGSSLYASPHVVMHSKMQAMMMVELDEAPTPINPGVNTIRFASGGPEGASMNWPTQIIEGDFSMVFKLDSISKASEGDLFIPLAGITIHDVADKPQPFTFAVGFLSDSVGFLGSASNTAAIGFVLGESSPGRWLKVVRNGEGMSAYYAQDGVNWVSFPREEPIKLGSRVQLKMMGWSPFETNTVTTVFSNVSISNGVSQATSDFIYDNDFSSGLKGANLLGDANSQTGVLRLTADVAHQGGAIKIPQRGYVGGFSAEMDLQFSTFGAHQQGQGFSVNLGPSEGGDFSSGRGSLDAGFVVQFETGSSDAGGTIKVLHKSLDATGGTETEVLAEAKNVILPTHTNKDIPISISYVRGQYMSLLQYRVTTDSEESNDYIRVSYNGKEVINQRQMGYVAKRGYIPRATDVIIVGADSGVAGASHVLKRLEVKALNREWGLFDVEQAVEIKLSTDKQLNIGGVSTFKRDRILNLHDAPKPNDFSASEISTLVDDLKVRYGRNTGSARWTQSQVRTSDPSRPGYIDTTALTNWCLPRQGSVTNSWSWRKLGYQDYIYSTQEQFLPGWNGPDAENLFIFSNAEAVAEWQVVFWKNYFREEERPPYFEIMNEPFVHAGEAGMTSSNVVDLHKVVIDRMHLEQQTPGVLEGLKMGGPGMAYPEFSKNNYGVWRDRMGRYLDTVGVDTDFISWHIYSTFFDDGDPVSHRSGSNVEYMLDLVDNYSAEKMGMLKPIIISEFGGGFKAGTTWRDSYTAQRDWYIIKSVQGKAMSFVARPDRIAKAIPFIVGKAKWFSGYNTNPYMWVSYRDIDPSADEEWVPTHLHKFYGLWKGVEGERLVVRSSDPNVQAHAFVKGQKVQLMLNSLNTFSNTVVSVANALNKNISDVESATLSRLFWNGTEPELIENQAVVTAQWIRLELRPEESVLLTLNFSARPAQSMVTRTTSFGDKTLQAYTGTALEYNLSAVTNRLNVVYGALRVGVTREHTETKIPIVEFNDVMLAAGKWAGGDQKGVSGGAQGGGGRSDFSGAIEFIVPENIITSSNRVKVSFDSAAGTVSSVALIMDTEALTR